MLSPVSSQQSTVTVENYPEINSEQQESALTSASPTSSSSRLGTVSRHLRGAVDAVSPRLVGGALAAASFLSEAGALTPVEEERHRWRQAHTEGSNSNLPAIIGGTVGGVVVGLGLLYWGYRQCKKGREQAAASGDVEMGLRLGPQALHEYIQGRNINAALNNMNTTIARANFSARLGR